MMNDEDEPGCLSFIIHRSSFIIRGVSMPEQLDLIVLWRTIVQAGGIPAWVDAQLQARGLPVTRRDAATLSDHERDAYKKQLKAEAAERRKLRKEAWQAYRANHGGHASGGGVRAAAPVPDR